MCNKSNNNTDINECEESENYCSDNERCVNTIGSFSCLCEAGYTRMNGSGPCQSMPSILVHVHLQLRSRVLFILNCHRR